MQVWRPMRTCQPVESFQGMTNVDDDNDPSPAGNYAHGMACAGIIAASHNSVGIAGLAPNVKIMPLRLFNYRGDAGYPYRPTIVPTMARQLS